MALSRADIERRIAELDEDPGWYQNIDLGQGISTKRRVVFGEDADHPRRRWEGVASAVPDDCTGLSVLDVGCNAGFLALEAARRGAVDVHGVDLKQGYVDQARFCAEVLDVPAKFEQRSVYNLRGLGREFDLVFFVGLLYHCDRIIEAVRQIASVSADTVIVESAIITDDGGEPTARYVGNDPTRPGSWHPSITAMQEMFLAVGFSSVEPLFKLGGRGGIVARR